MTTYQRYEIRHEGARDWRIWTVSTLTGDRKDCVSMQTTRAGILRSLRALQKARKEGTGK